MSISDNINRLSWQLPNRDLEDSSAMVDLKKKEIKVLNNDAGR